METPSRDFYLPFRVVMEAESEGALPDLLDSYAPDAVALIGDAPVFDNGSMAALEQELKSRKLPAPHIQQAPRPPLTTEAVARGVAKLRSEAPKLIIAMGGCGAMAYAARVSCRSREAKAPSSPAQCPTFLIPTTPLGALTAALPFCMTWDPLQDEIDLSALGEHYPAVVILNARQSVATVRIHPTDPGLAPLGLAVEALLNGHGDPFADALAWEAFRRLAPRIIPAAGGSEDASCWGNLLIGGLLAGMAYGRCGTAWGWSLICALRNVYRLDPGAVAGMLIPEIIRAGSNSAARRAVPLSRLWGTGQPDPLAAGRKVLDLAMKYSKSPLAPSLGLMVDLLSQRAPEGLRSLGRTARQMANQRLGDLGLGHLDLDNLDVIERWSSQQSLMAVAAELRTLNRRVAFLMDRPLNLKRAGIEDGLARLGRVAAVAQTINDQMAPQAPLEGRSLEDWLYAAYRTRQTPLEVDPRELAQCPR